MKIYSVPEAIADLVDNQVELALLTRNSLPNIMIVDRGKELLAKFKINDHKILQNSM